MENRDNLSSLSMRHVLPFLPERANFKLEGPGAAWLLVKLPVRGGDRCRRHQQIRILKRLLAPELLPALAHPGRIDAGIDDQVRDMNVFWAEFPRHRLGHGAEAEFGAG